MIKDIIEQLYPQEFSILLNKGNLVEDWSNVYEHCKLEGIIAYYLSNKLCLSDIDTNDLVKAAILHDWFKRVERESQNYDSNLSYKGLLELGYSNRIVDIAHSVGHTSLVWIEKSDLLRKIMHFIDDIVSGVEISEINIRVDFLEKSGRYAKLAEETRLIHNGRTLFEVQKEVGNKIQNEIENIADMQPGSLISNIINNI